MMKFDMNYESKKALVVCNGEPPSERRLTRAHKEADFFIAADGGFYPALGMGISPDAVVGDFDSSDFDSDCKWIILENRNQETNDLEKALDFILINNYTDVKILGATGKRTDHLLKNLSVLEKYKTRFNNLEIEDDYVRMFILPNFWEAELCPGTTVSLFPLSGKVTGITTSGLKFMLKDEDLENGKRDGSSNLTVSPKVAISYKTGSLLIIIVNPDTEWT